MTKHSNQKNVRRQLLIYRNRDHTWQLRVARRNEHHPRKRTSRFSGLRCGNDNVEASSTGGGGRIRISDSFFHWLRWFRLRNFIGMLAQGVEDEDCWPLFWGGCLTINHHGTLGIDGENGRPRVKRTRPGLPSNGAVHGLCSTSGLLCNRLLCVNNIFNHLL